MNATGVPPPIIAPDDEAQASSGMLKFFFGKLGRPQRNGARSNSNSSQPGLQQQSEPARNKERDARGGMQRSLAGVKDKEEVSPKPTEEISDRSPNIQGEVAKGRAADSDMLQRSLTDKPESSAAARNRAIESEEFLLSGRSASDSAEWDFRRREVRRSSRSAQEWVRESTVEASDWPRGLKGNSPDSQPSVLLASAAKHPPTAAATHIKEDGMLFRRRSKSAKDLANAEATGLPDTCKHRSSTRWSLENPRTSHDSKRTSFEAGFDQDLRMSSPRSAEKVRRHSKGENATPSDFLPAELIERSLLFNARTER